MNEGNWTAEDREIADHRKDHFGKTILVVLDKLIEEDLEIRAPKVLKLQPFCAYRAFIDAGECLQQFSAPLVDMFEGNIALEGVNHCIYKIDAFLRIWQASSEHLALSHFIVALRSYLADIFLDDLQFFRSDGEPTSIDGAADIVDKSGVLARS